jgi:hypothetical protein
LYCSLSDLGEIKDEADEMEVEPHDDMPAFDDADTMLEDVEQLSEPDVEDSYSGEQDYDEDGEDYIEEWRSGEEIIEIPDDAGEDNAEEEESHKRRKFSAGRASKNHSTVSLNLTNDES